MKNKRIIIATILIIIALTIAFITYEQTISKYKNKEKLEEVEFCDSKLAQEAGFIKVKHKFFGYEACVRT